MTNEEFVEYMKTRMQPNDWLNDLLSLNWFTPAQIKAFLDYDEECKFYVQYYYNIYPHAQNAFTANIHTYSESKKYNDWLRYADGEVKKRYRSGYYNS